MSPPDSTEVETVRPAPREEVGPQTLLERQESLSQRVLALQRRRREKFLRRAQAFTLRKEALRTVYIVGCLLLDTLVIPESALILPWPFGWGITIVTLIGALFVEFRLYQRYFGLPPSPAR
jgi:hypothetical protein